MKVHKFYVVCLKVVRGNKIRDTFHILLQEVNEIQKRHVYSRYNFKLLLNIFENSVSKVKS